MLTNTCYMCDAEATTVEHVPPKCIFPESKDLSSTDKLLDFRKQLITVPSCDDHNGKNQKMMNIYFACWQYLYYLVLEDSSKQKQR